ncbi:RrF2 family transcriptional regulator [Alkalicoccobacillus plakortidis]|uniref:HTH-type transcriptional regulator NsrR n=1 Tax=Alkalicoccobacillus plakortidis TaxID=444060 RepID=A0ABT0XNT6_9BACI|nr:Rrf2 family transcriptional regulator [Alkalicoccobacillus plakortidis]MCM2677395.1 Rrf2 family transcriptional regulator [Alkalicoccobacillus plakortidis]
MKLTLFTENSIKVLAYFVNSQHKTVITVKEVADYLLLSYDHLKKIFWNLDKKGYLDSIRGRNGGYQFNHNPNRIKLGTLVVELENLNVLSNKFIGNCELKKSIKFALDCFIKRLDQYTLDDLISENQKIS